MLLENEIIRLGGIKPLEEQYYPLSQSEIEAIEKTVGHGLPVEYVWLLSTYGECMFTNAVQFEPLKPQPEYKHPENLGIPNGADFHGSGVSTVYGKNHKINASTILNKLSTFRDRMPEGFLPFADDGLGNQLCLDLGSFNHQSLYWWNHELEWDEEDYQEETGTSMPREAKYQNVYLVANSLLEFFKRLFITVET